MKASNDTSILIIYTGGTIGMIEDPATGALSSFDFEHLSENVPELRRFKYQIDAITMGKPIDSSDMEPCKWADMARLIEKHYKRYDGFVILHGTDTMSYTAAALSYMLKNLAKPVIITGSQIPIGQLRTDGKENFLTSIEIAAAKTKEGLAMVPEVCIYFQSRLMRGNRATKINSEGFNAFRSFNYPSLAHAGIEIRYNLNAIHQADPTRPLQVATEMDTNILVVTLFPGIRKEFLSHVAQTPGLRGIILKTFGSGNAPQKPWLLSEIKRLCDRGILVVNLSQCSEGMVEMSRYETGLQLMNIGVLNGFDSTSEAMITKMMFLLGKSNDYQELRRMMNENIAGEITTDPQNALK